MQVRAVLTMNKNSAPLCQEPFKVRLGDRALDKIEMSRDTFIYAVRAQLIVAGPRLHAVHAVKQNYFSIACMLLIKYP